MNARIHFIRHGQTYDGADGQRHITENARELIRKRGVQLPTPDAALVSATDRTLETFQCMFNGKEIPYALDNSFATMHPYEWKNVQDVQRMCTRKGLPFTPLELLKQTSVRGLSLRVSTHGSANVQSILDKRVEELFLIGHEGHLQLVIWGLMDGKDPADYSFMKENIPYCGGYHAVVTKRQNEEWSVEALSRV